MFLHVAYRDQQPIMQELYRLRDIDSLTDSQKLWFRDHKPAFEFFDVENDPHEINDLSGDPKYAEKIKELSDEMDRWLTAINDTGIIPEKELMKRIWQDDSQPITADPSITITEEKVRIQCATEGASIGYKIIEGDQEPSSWQVYTEPFENPGDKKVRMIAHRIGYQPSREIVW